MRSLSSSSARSTFALGGGSRPGAGRADGGRFLSGVKPAGGPASAPPPVSVAPGGSRSLRHADPRRPSIVAISPAETLSGMRHADPRRDSIVAISPAETLSGMRQADPRRPSIAAISVAETSGVATTFVPALVLRNATAGSSEPSQLDLK